MNESIKTLNAVGSAVDARIDDLTGRIPQGTFCDDTNNCGGCLTPDECDELETLYSFRLRLNEAIAMAQGVE